MLRVGTKLERGARSSNLRRCAWAGTVRAFCNRCTAQTWTGSVVRIAVARRMLLTSETTRFAQSRRVRKPPSRDSTEQCPKHRRGATACTLHGFASPFAFRRVSQDSSLTGVCALLVHVGNPGRACTERLRTCMHHRAMPAYWPADGPRHRVTACGTGGALARVQPWAARVLLNPSAETRVNDECQPCEGCGVGEH